jgi:hydrogenase maturation protease
MKTLVLGIGSDILGDDGVGVRITQEIERQINRIDVVVRETGAAGLNLLELIRGYQRLIIVDAMLTDRVEAGNIHRLSVDSLSEISKLLTPHSASLSNILDIGKRLFPGEMPEDVVIYAVSVDNIEIVTDKMTPNAKRAIPRAAALIREEIEAQANPTSRFAIPS